MNQQEIFDKVVTELFGQGYRSVNSMNMCMYRGPDGAKCAVGFFIPDNEYSEKMEDMTVDQLSKLLHGGPTKDFLVKNERFLDKLQSIHDSRRNEDSEFVNKLRILAEDYCLNDSIISKTELNGVIY